jgi:hypothetical protein
MTVNPVLAALEAARWREISVWLSTNSDEQLARQLADLKMSSVRLMTIASLMDGNDPVDPPRSWKKDEQHLFAALPSELKRRVAERERRRDNEIRRLQNELGELKRERKAEKQQPPAIETQAAQH